MVCSRAAFCFDVILLLHRRLYNIFLPLHTTCRCTRETKGPPPPPFPLFGEIARRRPFGVRVVGGKAPLRPLLLCVCGIPPFWTRRTPRGQPYPCPCPRKPPAQERSCVQGGCFVVFTELKRKAPPPLLLAFWFICWFLRLEWGVNFSDPKGAKWVIRIEKALDDPGGETMGASLLGSRSHRGGGLQFLRVDLQASARERKATFEGGPGTGQRARACRAFELEPLPLGVFFFFFSFLFTFLLFSCSIFFWAHPLLPSTPVPFLSFGWALWLGGPLVGVIPHPRVGAGSLIRWSPRCYVSSFRGGKASHGPPREREFS